MLKIAMKELNAVEICVRLRAALLIKEKTLQVHSVFASAVNIIGKSYTNLTTNISKCYTNLTTNVSVTNKSYVNEPTNLTNISCMGFSMDDENIGHEGLLIRVGYDEIFFTLLSKKRSLYPMSCRVVNDISFIELGIKEGMEVIVSGDKILIPEANISINLKDSMERDLSFDKVEGLLVPKDLYLKVEVLKELIQEKGCEYDLSTLVTGKYKNPFAELVMKRLPDLNHAIKLYYVSNRARDQAINQAGELAGRLAGCGIGLTPSSDDMLVGYMSAYLADSKAKGCSFEDTYRITNIMGEKASKRTNTISGAFLKQCGRGLLSEDMMNLMRALYSNSKIDTIRKYGQRIQNFGSTSGTDMLTGIVLAVMNLNYNECSTVK